jgi:hypothetical protein
MVILNQKQTNKKIVYQAKIWSHVIRLTLSPAVLLRFQHVHVYCLHSVCNPSDKHVTFVPRYVRVIWTLVFGGVEVLKM